MNQPARKTQPDGPRSRLSSHSCSARQSVTTHGNPATTNTAYHMVRSTEYVGSIDSCPPFAGFLNAVRIKIALAVVPASDSAGAGVARIGIPRASRWQCGPAVPAWIIMRNGPMQ